MRKLTLLDVLFSQGHGTRRECAHLVLKGRVTLADGSEPHVDMSWADCQGVMLDGVVLENHAELYLMLNKAAGVECSHQATHHIPVFQGFPRHYVRRGLECAGRLDADTTGLLLLSTNGKFLHHVSSPRRGIPKTYLATLKHGIGQEQVGKLLEGVVLHGDKEPAIALSLSQVNEKLWRIQVGEGRYHLVKRMFAAIGDRVENLHRECIGDVSLGGLLIGSWRHLDPLELTKLGWNP